MNSRICFTRNLLDSTSATICRWESRDPKQPKLEQWNTTDDHQQSDHLRWHKMEKDILASPDPSPVLEPWNEYWRLSENKTTISFAIEVGAKRENVVNMLIKDSYLFNDDYQQLKQSFLQKRCKKEHPNLPVSFQEFSMAGRSPIWRTSVHYSRWSSVDWWMLVHGSIVCSVSIMLVKHGKI